jgi:regulatory protein
VKITDIKPQIKRPNRYSVYVDNKYEFSLSESALLNSKIVKGQDIEAKLLRQLNKLSNDDKIYSQVLNYAARNLKTQWEIKFYLQRKEAPPALIDNILNKLSDIGLVDDYKYAKTYINNKRLLHPTSRRKITFELRKKHIDGQLIDKALEVEGFSDNSTLQDLIDRKRRQAKYQDDLKLMQYLARQGYNYEDIKAALKT